MPISSFDAIYLVDLCEPLLEIARKRFAKHGWTNVHVICQDAATFILPEPEWAYGGDPKGSLSFVSFSYSLSMVCLSLLIINSNYAENVIDRYQISILSWTELNTYFPLKMVSYLL